MEKIKPKKKYPCPDCNFCQCCSESRCALCRSSPPQKGQKGRRPKVHKPMFLKY